MKAEQFPAWLESARSEGATSLLVQRARKGTGVQGTFDTLAVKGLDARALLERLREDVVEFRRARQGHFQLTALGKDGERLREERIVIHRDEDQEAADAPEDPTVAATRIYLTETRAAFSEMRATVHDARDMMVSANEALRGALKDVAEQNTQYQTKVGEMLGHMFDIAQQTREREADERASVERRAMMAKGLEEGLPILGMLLSKASKRTGPAMLSLFKSLDTTQLDQLTRILRAEQLATFSSLVDMVQKEQKGEGETNGAA